MSIWALLLAGGSGTRFWPLSRRQEPKQFLTLGGPGTLLEQTFARVQRTVPVEHIAVVTGAAHADRVGEQMPGAQVWVEPAAMNTAPAVALGMARIAREDPDAIVFVLPADHAIEDPDALDALFERAESLAGSGELVTFGVPPTEPATGFGYIECGEPVESNALRVKRFTEKPDAETAIRWVAGGNHLWNSGMFAWSVSGFFDELEKADETFAAAFRSVTGDDFSGAYDAVAPAPIDVVLLERSDRVVVLPAEIGWNDVGSWAALDLESCRALVTLDSQGNVVHAPGKVVAIAGVDDLVVVDTPDALLIVPKSRAQDVKELVAKVQEQDLDDVL